jgi:phage gp46-like protein
MSDIRTIWVASNGRGDWSLSGAQLQSGNDLQTSVLISLFTDRIANTDDAVMDGSGDPRGWWADDAQYPVGSRLWLLERAKQESNILIRARDYITEALQWLIDDGVVATFDIYVEWTRASVLGMQVIAHRQNGMTEAMNFAWAWKGTN